ncbi:site-specific integrase [uncultured Alcanivorax sp.]|jgi:integrase|uniref:site-specific integrase n=1 Tax=uncultured Alcanivorax sp. TaxID=191215 RepID=UPI0030DAEB08
MSDTKYLTLRGNTWLLNWRVPKDCKELFNGKSFITKSLQTHSLKEARFRRNQMLAEIEEQVQAHRQGSTSATSYRQMVRTLVSGDSAALKAEFMSVMGKITTKLHAGAKVELPKDLTDRLVDASVEEREDLKTHATIKAYAEVLDDPAERLHAKAVQHAYLGLQHDMAQHTLKEALKQHLKDNGPRLKVNTQTQTKKAVERLLTFLKKDDVALASIGRKQVKEFITASMVARSGSTVANYLSFLSSIWQHAVDLEEVSGGNPFSGHKIEKGTQSYQEFSPEQLQAIFKETEQYRDSTDDYYKFLLPRFGYMTGCRIEELCSLRCEQIITDPKSGIAYFEIEDGKTENAKRRIPLHDWIKDDVLAQKGRVGSGLLFPSLKSQRNDGKHGDRASKWFGRLKTKLGITGRQRSFHSFRVHMATNLERGGIEESTAVWIMGHTRNLSLSYGLYSKGLDLRQLKEAIDTIPAPVAAKF